MKKVLFLLLLMAILSSFAFVACSNKTEEDIVYNITDVHDFHIKASQTSYDFLEGVTAKNSNGEDVKISIDSRAVKFGVEGVYDIIYTAGTVSKNAKVYIYDTPTVQTTKNIFSRQEISAPNGFIAGLSVKDSFDKDLSVTILTDTNKFFEDGILPYGRYMVEYSTVDNAGNTLLGTRAIIVSDDGSIWLNCLEIDVMELSGGVDISGLTITGLLIDERPLGQKDYMVHDNYLYISESFILSLAKFTTYKMTVLDKDGRAYFNLIYTDKYPPSFTIPSMRTEYEMDEHFMEEISLPEATRTAQSYELSYAIIGPNDEDITINKTENLMSFLPTIFGNYTFKVTATPQSGEAVIKTSSIKISRKALQSWRNENDINSVVFDKGGNELVTDPDKIYGDVSGGMAYNANLSDNYVEWRLTKPRVTQCDGIWFYVKNETGGLLHFYILNNGSFGDVLVEVKATQTEWTLVNLTANIEGRDLTNLKLSINLPNKNGKIYFSDIYFSKNINVDEQLDNSRIEKVEGTVVYSGTPVGARQLASDQLGVKYSTEQKYGEENGSTMLTFNSLNGDGAALLSITALPSDIVDTAYGLDFYVYNTTGAEIWLFVLGKNKYAPTTIKISNATEWQKIALTENVFGNAITAKDLLQFRPTGGKPASGALYLSNMTMYPISGVGSELSATSTETDIGYDKTGGSFKSAEFDLQLNSSTKKLSVVFQARDIFGVYDYKIYQNNGTYYISIKMDNSEGNVNSINYSNIGTVTFDANKNMKSINIAFLKGWPTTYTKAI